MSGDIPARRLFLDPESEERRYFDEVGSFPIMHVIAIQEPLAVENPELPSQLMEIFHSAFDMPRATTPIRTGRCCPGVGTSLRETAIVSWERHGPVVSQRTGRT